MSRSEIIEANPIADFAPDQGHDPKPAMQNFAELSRLSR
jgi:hypothetical protein